MERPVENKNGHVGVNVVHLVFTAGCSVESYISMKVIDGPSLVSLTALQVAGHGFLALSEAFSDVVHGLSMGPEQGLMAS